MFIYKRNHSINITFYQNTNPYWNELYTQTVTKELIIYKTQSLHRTLTSRLHLPHTLFHCHYPSPPPPWGPFWLPITPANSRRPAKRRSDLQEPGGARERERLNGGKERQGEGETTVGNGGGRANHTGGGTVHTGGGQRQQTARQQPQRTNISRHPSMRLCGTTSWVSLAWGGCGRSGDGRRTTPTSGGRSLASETSSTPAGCCCLREKKKLRKFTLRPLGLAILSWSRSI